MVEIDLVHATEEYCQEYYQVQVSNQQEQQVEHSGTLFLGESLQEIHLLLLLIEREVLLAFDQEEIGTETQHHQRDLYRWNRILVEAER